ncbi:MAG: Asp-tRNA(Asn)/Glu-tRNA(Gln) amidotransferase subunit GatC [Polyangiaceae bacterium]|nr:Asp-tRNA(Asn)/Glu-tRNA(Gln) amidotransferase subunit GatC [Polyangiaceae bacterium]
MDKAQIRHIAELAELSLSSEEEEHLATEIGAILTYVAELEALDTTNVPPTTHAIRAAALEQSLRPDEVRPGLSHDDALAQAPKVLRDGFSVPSFVE